MLEKTKLQDISAMRTLCETEIYQMYWGAETSVRDLKYSIGLIHLYFRKLNSLWQEIYLAFIIMKSSMQRR